jgi:predicted phage gp36 major capsid-like protein
METLMTFGLGAGTVLIILGGVAVVKLVKQVKALKQTTTDIVNTMTQEVQHIHHRIDDTERTLTSTIDSRLDKLEQRLSGNLGAKQVIKG